MVSSRSKTAAEAAANRRTTRSTGAVKPDENQPNPSPKAKATKAKAPSSKASSAAQKKEVVTKASKGKKGRGKKAKEEKEWCVCKGADDGTPMIHCEGECQNWYHFRCINLSEDVAEEIEKYYCPECEAKTGLKTVSKLDFEGPEALLEVATPPGEESKLAKRKKSLAKEDVEGEKEIPESAESDNNEGSDEDFVDGPSEKKTRRGKRVTRRLSFSDKSESDVTEDDDASGDGGRPKRAARRGRTRVAKRVKKASSSPAPGSSSDQALKRRNSSAVQPAAKRSKTESEGPASDDPMRKYCVSKLQEIIAPMFLEHREGQRKDEVGSGKQDEAEGAKANAEADVESEKETEPGAGPEELSELEKTSINQKVSAFVAELEHCMMKTYAEPDKSGRSSAGPKYKERFRMLSFNLAKPDRIALRKGIALGRITPAQLNVMSSTDLANEHLKHEIEVAEKEALEHSILQRVTAPRAKMTHKGFETIEDVSGSRNTDAQRAEEEEDRMEMEKREREREKLARLRSLSIAQGEASSTEPGESAPLSASLPPISPTSTTMARSNSMTWGAPPPLPTHVLQQQQDAQPSVSSPLSGRPPMRAPFGPSPTDFMSSMEGGLNLADLINIDDDESETPAQGILDPVPQFVQGRADSVSTISTTPEITTPSGPSPFTTAKPLVQQVQHPVESTRRASFDLNSLWTGQEKIETENPEPDTGSDQGIGGDEDNEASYIAGSPEQIQDQDDAMDIESADEDEDQAFDAILEQNEAESALNNAQSDQKDLNTIPPIWAGQISMPLDQLNALAPAVSAKQIGGRVLDPHSGYWQTLFPSPQARIDGRVPVDKSTQYLVTTRMNPAKELIAVCFIPSSEDDSSKSNELVDFLIKKERHALVFPWGVHPKPQAPGRELYIIPLLKDAPIPEYIELLDNVHLPKERTSNILLGMFVLNKGKLLASTPPPVPTIPTASVMSSSQILPYAPAPGMAAPRDVIPSVHPLGLIPGLTGAAAMNSIPSSASTIPPPPTHPVKIDPSALAAEVATLTPEQISLMLRHLGRNVAPIPSAPPAQTALPLVPPIPGAPGFGVPPPFPPQFTPPFQQHPNPVPPFPSQSPPGPPPPSGYGDRDEYQRQPSFGRDDRGGRGGRGRGSERGRRGGRGRGKLHDDNNGSRYREREEFKPADQGWGSRGRGGSSPRGRRTRFGE